MRFSENIPNERIHPDGQKPLAEYRIVEKSYLHFYPELDG
jgi:hypothetical protein